MTTVRNQELLYLSQRTNMEISEISYGFLDPSWNIKNLYASFTRVYFPLEGEGLLTFENERIPLVKGNIYIIPSYLNFSGSCRQKLNKIYVHLNLTHPNGSDLFSGIRSCIILKNRQNEIDQVAELYEKNDVTAVLQLKLLLFTVLSDALREAGADLTPLHYSPETKAALAYVDSHLRADLTISEIASAIFCSKQLLQKNFKEDIGKPLGKYVDDILMSHAERALLNPSLSIKEISDRLGFCDQFYFSRKFNEIHGISPRQFRQMHNV